MQNRKLSSVDQLEIALLLRAEELKWKNGLDLGELLHDDHKMYMKGGLDATQKALEILLGVDANKFIIED